MSVSMPDGIILVGLADDVAVTTTVGDEELLMDAAKVALLRVSHWLQNLSGCINKEGKNSAYHLQCIGTVDARQLSF